MKDKISDNKATNCTKTIKMRHLWEFLYKWNASRKAKRRKQ